MVRLVSERLSKVRLIANTLSERVSNIRGSADLSCERSSIENLGRVSNGRMVRSFDVLWREVGERRGLCLLEEGCARLPLGRSGFIRRRLAETGDSSALKGFDRRGLQRPVTRAGRGDDAVLWQSTSISIGNSSENESENSIEVAILLMKSNCCWLRLLMKKALLDGWCCKCWYLLCTTNAGCFPLFSPLLCFVNHQVVTLSKEIAWFPPPCCQFFARKSTLLTCIPSSVFPYQLSNLLEVPKGYQFAAPCS